MVIVEVSGGLGNQMFQYALYRKMKSIGKDVMLDTSYFRSRKKIREWELDIFELEYDEITDKEAAHIKGWGYNDTVLDKVKYIINPSRYTVYKDKIEFFQPEIFDMDDVYLSGYWQNQKYFLDIRPQILESFSFPEVTEKDSIEILKEVQKENSVAVHVRRGDYLLPTNVNIYGGICTERYYQKAITFMNEYVENPRYYYFTDDPMWVKENLYRPGMEIVENNKAELAYLDMYLMSQCKHNIIANSSFSWWGAWLNRNENKIVVGPERWFQNHSKTDIVCDNWITL